MSSASPRSGRRWRSSASTAGAAPPAPAPREPDPLDSRGGSSHFPAASFDGGSHEDRLAHRFLYRPPGRVREADPALSARGGARRLSGVRRDAEVEHADLHVQEGDPRQHGGIQAARNVRLLARQPDRRRKRRADERHGPDRKSTRLNSSHSQISYAVFCLKKKTKKEQTLDLAAERLSGLTARV